MNLTNKKLILLELNEINFNLVEMYLKDSSNHFPSLAKLLNGFRIETSSENEYKELEPWIQWVSVHSGMTFKEHGVFRLGDIVNSDVKQIFEELEFEGFRVGAVCAMNAANRLKDPAYFIPDPWTATSSDTSWWSRKLSKAISQAVNDNAQKRITLKSLIYLFLAFIRFARVRHIYKFLSLLINSRKKPWLKSLVLDLFLHDMHWNLFESKNPNFSTLFLNAGAHIQHHYYFNAKPIRNASLIQNPSWYVPKYDDPIRDLLKVYDLIIGELYSRSDSEIIIATGLSQKPYDRVKYYYRLKYHSRFLKKIGVNFKYVYPRMTRDFLIVFENNQLAVEAFNILSNIRVSNDGDFLFGEIDNRGDSLFVTLSYPNEITNESIYSYDNRNYALLPEVSFVAIKNGMHQGQGFAFFSPGVQSLAPKNKSHIAQIGKSIRAYFLNKK